MIRLLFSVFLLAGCATVEESLPSPPPSRAIESDWIRGGALYDKWWVVAETATPQTNHPLWSTRPDKETNPSTGAATWRCTECHGWDYQGVAGAYGTGTHRTGFPGVSGATTKDAKTLFKIIRDWHGYGQAGLQNQDIHDLVAFIQKGVTDVQKFMNEKKVIRGDLSAGKTAYHASFDYQPSCADCHGDTGLTAPGSPDFDDYLGKVGTQTPEQLIHKIRFGQPGTEMPAAEPVVPMDTLMDLSAYIQSLPHSP